MPKRTTPTQVEKIGSFSSSANLEPFIEAASDLVDELAAKSDVDHDDRRLELIERYLSAHFASLSGITGAADVKSKSIGSASTSWNRSAASGDGLSATSYGKMSMQLDSSHWLRRIMEGGPKTFWLGTEDYGLDSST